MKTLFRWLLLAAGLFATPALAQPAQVQKTNKLPVYMHYMPWFETPATNNGNWGYHWTFNNRNPNVVDGSGKRQIASHFYPLIGPYASSDPDVVEYHLLLMKLSGIDGVLVDWYGTAGNNGDIGSLLRNSNALINRTAGTGLKFGLILEDRFTGSVDNGRANLDYARQNYFSRPEYIRYNNAPLLGVFGPITFNQPSQWTSILAAAGQDVEFLTLWDNDNAGGNADGQYVWPYQSPGQTNFLSYMEAYYRDRAPSKKTVMGVAYPGYYDFYAEGGAGASNFYIPHNNGQTLDQTLGLVDRYRSNIDLLQLATFNDFGEGTIFEPTQETGFSYLARVQRYTGVSYTEADLKQVYRLYNLRKKYAGNAAKQNQLNQAFNAFVALRLPDAVAALNAADNTNPPPPPPISGDPNLAGVYTLQNRLSGLNLEVASASQADRARVQQYQNNGCTCQQFRLTHLGNGLYSIIAQHSGKGLDVNYVSQDNGAAIVQWPYVGGANQQFYAIGTGGGYYKLVAKHSGKAIEVADLSKNNGTIVQQYTDNGGAQQQWKLNPVGTPPPPATSSVFIEAERYSAFNNAQLEACTDQGGGQDVGYLKPGSWLAYNNIRFPVSGTYTIEYRVASASNGGRFGAELQGGAVQLGLVDVPNTGGWQTWRTITQQVNVTAGTYNFGLNVKVGDWNINWLRITPPPTAAAAQSAAMLAAPAPAALVTGLDLYPNPATDRLQVRAGHSLAGSYYQLFDATGRLQASGTLDAAGDVNVATLRAGVYLFVVTTPDQQRVTRRLIKQ